MAFSVHNLSVLAHANGITLWHYNSKTQPCVETTAIGYFANAAALLTAGDMVMVSGSDGEKVATISGSGKSITLEPL